MSEYVGSCPECGLFSMREIETSGFRYGTIYMEYLCDECGYKEVHSA